MGSEAKFTPGPWRCTDNVNVIAGPHRVVATMAFTGVWNHGEQEMNAALVAAAPEMFRTIQYAEQAMLGIREAFEGMDITVPPALDREITRCRNALHLVRPTPPDAAQGSPSTKDEGAKDNG